MVNCLFHYLKISSFMLIINYNIQIQRSWNGKEFQNFNSKIVIENLNSKVTEGNTINKLFEYFFLPWNTFIHF